MRVVKEKKLSCRYKGEHSVRQRFSSFTLTKILDAVVENTIEILLPTLKIAITTSLNAVLSL